MSHQLWGLVPWSGAVRTSTSSIYLVSLVLATTVRLGSGERRLSASWYGQQG